ncbi:hypothetical protein F5884DRAFT_871294 [Xylogone sp. PMI_703]|nr:hypothetical protein F5884DRAFT_871294 [Xylogone sp. PMI_703]
MSRQAGASRRRTRQQRALDREIEAEIEGIRAIVTSLYEVASQQSEEWESHLPSARTTMSTLDRLQYFRDPDRFDEQIWIIRGFQDYAFHDTDSGTIQDVATWCQGAWLSVLRNHPENMECLCGLGQIWHQRAQATLARIHSEEGSESSSGGSGHNGKSSRRNLSELTARSESPLYVEARGYLHPAVDFYQRAVAAADARDAITGELLSSAAEAHMSMGSVNSSPADEQYFINAIHYLRRAQTLPGFQLAAHLEQYLNDYGRYVN